MSDNDRNDDAPEYTKQYYDDAKIDRMVGESAYYIDDDQTNARQHLVAIIRQLRTERDAERQKSTPPPTENHAAAPGVAERAAIRAEWDKPKHFDGPIEAVKWFADHTPQLWTMINALEAENAVLRHDLEFALDMILHGDANHDDLMWADMTHTERFGAFNRPEGE